LDFRRLPVRVAAGLGHSAGRVSAVASTASFAVVVRDMMAAVEC
jgi:malonyl CoA-acyl carrier protein transacylase